MTGPGGSALQSGADGGYFAGPVSPVQPPGGYDGPAGFSSAGYSPPEYGVPAQPGRGSHVPVPVTAGGGAPPLWVVAAATVLVLTGAAAGWLATTAVVALQAVGGAIDGEGVLVKALLLLLNAVANLAVAYQLLRGSELARWLTAAVCTWWTGYWLWQTSKVSEATGTMAATPFLEGMGQVGTMLTLGLLGLASLAATTAGVLWHPSTRGHFGR